jgi:hypothetical protein
MARLLQSVLRSHHSSAGTDSHLGQTPPHPHPHPPPVLMDSKHATHLVGDGSIPQSNDAPACAHNTQAGVDRQACRARLYSPQLGLEGFYLQGVGFLFVWKGLRGICNKASSRSYI